MRSGGCRGEVASLAGLCDNLGVGHRAIEVPVGLRLGAEEPRYVLASHP